MNLYKQLVVLSFLSLSVFAVQAKFVEAKIEVEVVEDEKTLEELEKELAIFDELRGLFLKLRDKEKAFIVDAFLNGKVYDLFNDKDKQKFLELVALCNDKVFSKKYGNVVEKFCLNMTRVLYGQKINSLAKNNSALSFNNALLTGMVLFCGYFLWFR